MERESEVRRREVQRSSSRVGKRRLSSSSSSSSGNSSSVDVEMATATLSVPKEPSRSYGNRTTPRRRNQNKKKAGKKEQQQLQARGVVQQQQQQRGEVAGSSAVDLVVEVNPLVVVDASESPTPVEAVPDAPESEEEAAAGADAPLIPGLPDQLALHVLALVPLSYHQPLKGVCRKWKRCLSGSTANEVVRLRTQLGVKETWVFLLASGGVQRHPQWRAFDPVHNRWRRLPQCPCDYTFDSCDKESAVAGTQLLVTGHSATGPTVWRYDLHSNAWCRAAKMIKNRCLFASASHGKFAYFAGGYADSAVLKSAEKYNSESEEWEPLPDLHVNRKWCSGCILDNKFFVIGGQGSERQSLTSGEYYDEVEKRWVIVENMWPAARTQAPGQTAPPLVAVVKDQLYAADASTMELNAYHKGTNTWRPLGPVPSRSVDSSGWGMGFKAVENEIFVIGGSSDRGNGQFCDQIHAWPPSPNVAGWREVGQLPNTSGFILNCAVMIV